MLTSVKFGPSANKCIDRDINTNPLNAVFNIDAKHTVVNITAVRDTAWLNLTF